MKHKIDLNNFVGKEFNRLTTVRFVGRNKYYHPLFECRCKCNNVLIVPLNALKSGNTKSCGCLQIEAVKKNFTTHGFRSGSKTQKDFYYVWSEMKNRCLNATHKRYKDYGGRGITVCDRWLGTEGFENFRDDMWESYLKHKKRFGNKGTTLDRWPHMNGHYEPYNVRWATWNEQNIHRRDSAVSSNYGEHLYQRDFLQRFLNCSVQKNRDSKLFIERFGCSLLDFTKHIESQFLPGMNWDNRGANKNGQQLWQFDHIEGCNKFDLSKEEDRKKCFNYKNLRPMWWKDHQAKTRATLY